MHMNNFARSTYERTIVNLKVDQLVGQKMFTNSGQGMDTVTDCCVGYVKLIRMQNMQDCAILCGTRMDKASDPFHVARLPFPQYINILILFYMANKISVERNVTVILLETLNENFRRWTDRSECNMNCGVRNALIDTVLRFLWNRVT